VTNDANGNAATAKEDILGRRLSFRVADPTKSAFLWLSVFFLVYCARPEDWIPALKYIPLAKISGLLALWGLFKSLGRTQRAVKDLPRESRLLLAMILLLFVGGFLSPVWKGGAVARTIDFSKIYIAWVLVFLLITTFERLRKIIYIQAASVVVVSLVSVMKGHNMPRLEGVLGGIYSNPNDLAFAIVLTMPFALAFLLTAKNGLVKVIWAVGLLCMMTAIFLTASRAGFIDLVVMGAVTLYHFGIRGKRFSLIVVTAVCGLLIVALAGGKLYDRFAALSGDSTTDQGAEGSYEERKYLMQRAVEGIENYPVFGIGVNDFNTYSGIWHEVHMTYLQVAVEGGIPVLVLYLMFFWHGFKNLRILFRTKNLDEDTTLFVGALHASLIGFAVGALFAPEGFQFFPYFAVAFTSALLQTVREQERQPSRKPVPLPKRGRHFLEAYAEH
jgi:hypothetical protein